MAERSNQVSRVRIRKDSVSDGLRYLWTATLKVGGTRKDSFLFRSTKDFGAASETAQRLLETSPAAEMSGAELLEVKFVAYLWN